MLSRLEWQAKLLERLSGVDLLDPLESSFVLFWTYFQEVGLGIVENRASAQGIHPLRLEAHRPMDPWPQSHGVVLRELAALSGPELDLLALRWLISLDRRLKDRRDKSARPPRPGLDDQPYVVCRRNSYLADGAFPQLTWEAEQSLSLAAYTRSHQAVPVEPIEGISIDIRGPSTWGDKELHGRLEAEKRKLRVMLWPLQTAPDYPALDLLGREELPAFVRLDEVRNESALCADVMDALEQARHDQVTLLIFPELAIPPGTREEIRAALAKNGRGGYPVLTLFGCCHYPAAEDGLDVNEAILLGPDGSELHRHCKITSYSFRKGGQPSGERNKKGDFITVLECHFGNLTPLICLDLINVPVQEILRRSHGNFFAVPSLSPETRAHRTVARNLQVSNQASTFVCNRWLTSPRNDEEAEEGTSFYQLPRKDGYRAHLPDPKGRPFLLFSL